MSSLASNNHGNDGLRQIGRISLTIFQYAWLAIAVALVLIPVLWAVVASLTEGKLLSGVPLIPDVSKFSLEHYEYLFTYKTANTAVFSDFVAAFGRTLSVAVVNMVVVVIFTTLAAYSFSRFNFKGKKPLLIGLLLLQMFPSFMGMLAIFMMFRTFGWLNQPLYLVLLYFAGAVPYNIYLIRGFMKAIPKSLDEAARIDGASNMTIFFKIILPLSKPIMGFVAVNAFMSPWMDFMLPSQLLSRGNETVGLILYRWTDPLVTLTYNPLNFMAGGLVLAIPIVIVNILSQRFIVYGQTAGADKG